MSNVKIEISSRSRVGKSNKNTPDSCQKVNLGHANTKLIDFTEIVFVARKMQIRRAGIDDINIKKISSYRFSIPIDYNLIGEYELVKIHDELFQLVKIEENEK
jgi:hypothetical protein